MTQEELGDYLGVKKSAIQKYESGAIVNLKAETIRKLCDLFDVLPAMFIYDHNLDVLEHMKNYKKMNDKWLKSDTFANCCIGALSLNDEALKKVKDYIDDLSKIKEYRENE